MTCPGFKSRLAGAQSSLGLHRLLPTGSWLAHVHMEGGCPPVFHASMMCVWGEGRRTRVWSGIMWRVCGPVWPCGCGGTHVYTGAIGIKRPPSPGPAVGGLDWAVLSCLREWSPVPDLGPPHVRTPGLAFVSSIGARRREWAPWEFQWNSRHSAFQGSRRPLEKSH